MNVCSIWPFAQISDDFYYLDIWQCARYFVATLLKKFPSITIREIRGLESRSRLLWHSFGLVSKFEPGLGLGGCCLDYITAKYPYCDFGWAVLTEELLLRKSKKLGLLDFLLQKLLGSGHQLRCWLKLNGCTIGQICTQKNPGKSTSNIVHFHMTVVPKLF